MPNSSMHRRLRRVAAGLACAGLVACASGPVPPPDAERQVRTESNGDVVEEYRVNGKLYMLKVTPKYGPAYYLIDERGDGQWSRQNTLDSGLRVPMWVIGTF